MNEQTKHTPGPWYVELDVELEGGYLSVCRSNDDRSVVTIGWNPSDEDKANARLIAAAPELLRVCQMVSMYLEALDDFLDSKSLSSDVSGALHPHLQKAIGMALDEAARRAWVEKETWR